jgi:glyoxylase-like metal-dependent hydrolase (beta-lactamase superfamily II)
MSPDSQHRYSGAVRPGGAADSRELTGLTITKFAVDEKMSNNCYLLTCRTTGERALIDAAADTQRILEVLGGGRLSTVITTHQHWDHHRSLADVVAATGADALAGSPDADAITEQTGVPVDRRLEDGNRIAFGDIELEVITIVGHTPGSVALLYRDPDGSPHLFTGDSLFPGGVGATFGDSAAFVSLIDDVEKKIFGTLPDDTWFYPGHGNDSTLGVERPHLAEWRERGW